MQKGFTLIEVLIVMVIISIVGGVAILTISHNQNTRLETLAKQLTNVISLAEEQAMLQPAVLGLAFTENTFQFYQYKDTADKNTSPWQGLTDSVLGLHRFPSDIQIRLKIENKTIPVVSENDLLQPQLIISTSGDITPFTLLIGKANQKPRYKVVGEANGNIFYEIR